MGGHERPSKLVPSFGTKGYEFMIGCMDCEGLGFLTRN